MSKRKQFRRDMRRHLRQADRHLEWVLNHFAQMEYGAKSALNIDQPDVPLEAEDMQKLPVLWQQCISAIRLIGSGLIDAQQIIRHFSDKL